MTDHTGKRFGRLAVEGFSHVVKKSGYRYYWDCICDCGNRKKVCITELSSGDTKSCGCLSLEVSSLNAKTHGMTNSRFYRTWESIKRRCLNKNQRFYDRYGGRGIVICEEWMKFDGFKEDMLPSYLESVLRCGERDTTIDRIDNNGNYAKENCRWVSQKQQNRNRNNNHLLTYSGETKPVIDWSDETGIPYATLIARINKLGWSPEKSLTTPVRVCQR